MKANTLTIRTQEGVSFALPLAGPISRFMAWAIDITVIGIISSLLGTLTGIFSVVSPDLAIALSILINFTLSIGYSMVLEWFWRGQTLGKRLFGLRVMDAEGLRLQPSQVVLRNLLRVVDGLPYMYFVGGISCMLSRKSQRLGDIAANTIVVRMRTPGRPDLDQVLPDKYNSFRDYPHLAARLRQQISPEEAGLALQVLFRREHLESDARLQLFTEMADHFRGLVEFPQEAVEGLSAERYVRNVLDIVYRWNAAAAPA